MKKEKLMCFKCKKEIDPSSNYYSFLEFNKKKFIRADHSHRECWDNFLKKVGDASKAQDFLSRINLTPLENLGLLKPKEVIIE